MAGAHRVAAAEAFLVAGAALRHPLAQVVPSAGGLDLVLLGGSWLGVQLDAPLHAAAHRREGLAQRVCPGVEQLEDPLPAPAQGRHAERYDVTVQGDRREHPVMGRGQLLEPDGVFGVGAKLLLAVTVLGKLAEGGREAVALDEQDFRAVGAGREVRRVLPGGSTP